MKTAVTRLAFVSGLVLATSNADAQLTLPYFQASPNLTGSLFQIQQSGYGSAYAAIEGDSNNGAVGVLGNAPTFTGVEGNTYSGIGVRAIAGTANGNSGTGLYATATGGTAVSAAATDDGLGTYGTGVSATATGGTGVYGSSQSGVGVFGITSAGTGWPAVEGAAGSSTAIGVLGTASGGDGVYGKSTSGNGVHGLNTSGGNGVFGESGSASNCGVYGQSNNGGYGVGGTTTGAGIAVYGHNSSTTGWSGYFTGRAYVALGLNVAGTCIAGNCTSDVRLKKDIHPLAGGLDRLMKLRPVTFEWKHPEESGNTPGPQIGFIAQEVEKVMPEWVGVNDQGFKTVNRNGLDVMLVASVQALKTENDELHERVKSLEAGRRPLVSGFGEGGIGLGLCAIAGALIVTRRRRSDGASH